MNDLTTRNDDARLLREYADGGSETAFRELVERHLPLVNATARRMVAGDTHLAKDVAQTVFTDLARKAGTLPDGVILGGWLHRHTCFTASKAVRAECRRRARERTAMEIEAVNDAPGADAQWQKLAPVLDEALNGLPARDRDAIVLRYLQGRDLRSIGAAFGASDDAAQKRIARALEKLRRFLVRRGLTLSAALLATTLDAQVAPAVTGELAGVVSASALQGAAAAGSVTLTSILTKMITSKMAVGIAASAAVAAAATFYIVHDNEAPEVALTPAPVTVSAPVVAQPSEAVAVTRPATPTPGVEPMAPATGTQEGPRTVMVATSGPGAVPVNRGQLQLSQGTIPTNGTGTLVVYSGTLQMEEPTGPGVVVYSNGTTVTSPPEGLPSGAMVINGANGTLVITGNATPGGATGTYGAAGDGGVAMRSVQVSMSGDTATVTTNENGVVQTQTVPASAVSGGTVVVSGDNNGNGAGAENGNAPADGGAATVGNATVNP